MTRWVAACAARYAACRLWWRRTDAAALSSGAPPPEAAIRMLADSGGGAGRGWFATRRLRAGERILAEAPIVADSLGGLARHVLGSASLRNGLHLPSQFPPQPDQPQGCSPEAWSRAMAQATSNGFRAPGGKMLLLAQTSLFNHSCHPNAAVYRHDADREKVQVRVLRDVGEGQEVALCYDSALYHMPTARRRELLRARWGFECGCPRCTGSATPADPLRSSASGGQLAALETEFDRCAAAAEAAIGAASLALQSEAAAPPEAASGLADAIALLQDALALADGSLQVTHWRMQQTLKSLCVCLWLRHMLVSSADASPPAGAFDPDLGSSDAADVAQLRRMLHVALAAEASTSPPLHPMRLELYGMWRALPPSGDEWKTVGVFEDLDRLWALWEDGEETHVLS